MTLPLFPDLPTQPLLAARLVVMHTLYGVQAKQRCGSCCFLEHHSGHSRTYLKCAKTRITHGPGSDWRARWSACGLWQPRGELI